MKKSGVDIIENIEIDEDYALRKKQTLRFNFWIIFGTWLPFVFIAVYSNSLTLIAQMLMGGAQSLTVYLSWMSTKKSYKQQRDLPNSERLNAQFMAIVFLASFIVVLVMAVDRFVYPRELNKNMVFFGLIVNSFAVLVNFYQWKKNRKLSKLAFSLVMESQQSLFFIKFFTVLTVEISLALFFLFEGKGVHDYVDTFFSVALAFLTLYSAFGLFRKSSNVMA